LVVSLVAFVMHTLALATTALFSAGVTAAGIAVKVRVYLSFRYLLGMGPR
jgi:hypothetical protein